MASWSGRPTSERDRNTAKSPGPWIASRHRFTRWPGGAQTATDVTPDATQVVARWSRAVTRNTWGTPRLHRRGSGTSHRDTGSSRNAAVRVTPTDRTPARRAGRTSSGSAPDISGPFVDLALDQVGIMPRPVHRIAGFRGVDINPTPQALPDLTRQIRPPGPVGTNRLFTHLTLLVLDSDARRRQRPPAPTGHLIAPPDRVAGRGRPVRQDHLLQHQHRPRADYLSRHRRRPQPRHLAARCSRLNLFPRLELPLLRRDVPRVLALDSPDLSWWATVGNLAGSVAFGGLRCVRCGRQVRRHRRNPQRRLDHDRHLRRRRMFLRRLDPPPLRTHPGTRPCRGCRR